MKYWLIILSVFGLGQLNGQVRLNFIQHKAGSDLTYICVVESFNDMMGFQSTLTWNPDTMAYNTIEFSEFIPSAMVNPNMVDKGHLPMVWLTTDGPLSLQKCDTLFTMRFQDKLGLSSLKFGDAPVKTEFVDMQGRISLESDIVATCALTTSTRREVGDRFDVIPNIVTRGGTFKVWSTSKENLSLELLNNQGSTIFNRQNVINKDLDAPDTPGVYFYIIRDQNELVHTGKLIIL